MANVPQALPGHRDDAPVIGGDRPDPIGHLRIGNRGQQAQAPDPTEPAMAVPQMSEAEQHWFDKSAKLEAENARLSMLAPYAEVIGYLEANPDAVNLVLGHMKGVPADEKTYSNDFERDFDEAAEAGQPPVQPAANPRPVANQNMAEVKIKLREQYDAILKEKGVPEHEKDRFIQFLMAPDDLKPEELYEMFANLQNNRKSASQSQTDNTSQALPKANAEVPPMSVAGINGGTSDPRTDADAEARSKARIMIDPNNL